MNKNKIKIVPYYGEEIAPLIPEIARLRMEIFREYPFLYSGDEEYEKKYLSKFLTAEDAIVIVAFDGSTIIGVLTGLPLVHEVDELKEPFHRTNRQPADYYYLAECILKKAYRGLRIAQKFIHLLEEHVAQLSRFHYICLCTVHRAANDPRRPVHYRSPNQFWKKRGYEEHPELKCYLSWREINEKKEMPNEMIFWIKKLKNLS